MVVTTRRGRCWRVRVAAVISIAALSLTGCQPPAGGGRPVSAGGDHVVILVSGSSVEPLPALPPDAEAELVMAANSDKVSDGPRGRGSVADVVSVDGATRETLPLTPRRADGSVEHGFQRDTLIEQNVQAVIQAVSTISATRTGLDLLEGMAQAVRGLDGGTLIVVSNGLSTAGGLDLRELGWDADPQAAAKQVAEAGLLQSLAGFRVLFANLGGC